LSPDTYFPKITIDGGDFVNGCKFDAKCYYTCKLIINNANINDAKIICTGDSTISGTSLSIGAHYISEPLVEINNGNFENVFLLVEEASLYCDAVLKINNRIFTHCGISSLRASSNAYVNGGSFYGCKFLAFCKSRWNGNKVGIYFKEEDSSSRPLKVVGCSFLADSSGEYTGGSAKGYPVVTIKTEDNKGTFIDCSTEKLQGPTSVTTLTLPTIGNVGTINGEGVLSLLTTLQEKLESNQNVSVCLTSDSYTPVLEIDSNYVDWNYGIMLNDEVITVDAGENLEIIASTVNKSNYVVDSNFSVAGTGIIRLLGGYYTGNFEIAEGGIICAAPGTRFKYNPGTELTFTKPANLVEDNGEYLVEETPGFMIIVR
jgi:hypothetical protein